MEPDDLMKDEASCTLARLLMPYGLNLDQNKSQTRLGHVLKTEGFEALEIVAYREREKELYYHAGRPLSRWLKHSPVYHALLPHWTFRGDRLKPIWVNKNGRSCLAFYEVNGTRTLLVGLNIEEEIVRHRQGDPTQADKAVYKGGLGLDYERPDYLFADQLLAKFYSIPWADRLGFALAESYSRIAGYPLIEPLPNGARGLVILTGDDDQAPLECYIAQLRLVGNVPITYFLHPLTHHTSETIKNFPPNVEFGVHPDALDQPGAYSQLCADQVAQIRLLTGKSIRAVRNHGFLNSGYLGHLPAWEKLGLKFDVNYPGVDGKAVNGSFLPMRVRRPDGTWSDHYSLLTMFGDGMLYALKMTPRQAVRRIRNLAQQIENEAPGVMVLNLHPTNVLDTQLLHDAVLNICRRPGWMAMGMESYLDWLEGLEQIRFKSTGPGRFSLSGPTSMNGLVLRFPVTNGWYRQPVSLKAGSVKVAAP